MKKLLALSIAHGLILSVASCSFDVVKPLFDNENNEVGAINCTKQKLLIKDSIEPMTSFGYKTGKWLTAGQHQIEVNKSGIKSFQGHLHQCLFQTCSLNTVTRHSVLDIREASAGSHYLNLGN